MTNMHDLKSNPKDAHLIQIEGNVTRCECKGLRNNAYCVLKSIIIGYTTIIVLICKTFIGRCCPKDDFNRYIYP